MLHTGVSHQHRRSAAGPLFLQKLARHRLLVADEDDQEPADAEADGTASDTDAAVAEESTNSSNATVLNFTEILTTTMAPIEVALTPSEDLGKKCTLGDVSCGPLHENAVVMVGEAQ